MSLTTQQSILIGFVAAGCLIGGGIYFGLASGRGDGSASKGSSSSVSGRETDRPLAPTPPSTRNEMPAPAASANPAQVAADAKKAVEATRPALLKKCWETSGAPVSSAASWNAVLNLTFDATGMQIVRGLMVDRSTTRHDVTSCVNDNLPTLKIPAPGAVATAEVPMSLP